MAVSKVAISPLYNKIIEKGGQKLKNGKVCRVFSSAVSGRTFEQVYSPNGSFKMRVWQGDNLLATVKKNVIGLKSVTNVWDYLKSTRTEIRKFPGLEPKTKVRILQAEEVF